MANTIPRKYESLSRLSTKEFKEAISEVERSSPISPISFSDEKNKNKFLCDKDVALYAIRKNAQNLSLFTAFSDDIDVVTKAIIQDGTTLVFASERLKNSLRIVKRAIVENPNAINFASATLRNNKKYAYSLIKTNPDIISLTSFPEEFYDDKEFALYAAKTDEAAFLELSCRLRDDEEVATIGIESSADNFGKCSDRLKNDRDFALWAISKGAWNIQHVKDKKFLKDFDFVKTAIEGDFLTFQLINQELWKDERLISYSKDLSMPQWNVYMEILNDKNQYEAINALESFYKKLSVSEKNCLLERYSHELIENIDGIKFEQQVFSKHQLKVIDWVIDGLDSKILSRPIENVSLDAYIKEEVANRKIKAIQKPLVAEKKARKTMTM